MLHAKRFRLSSQIISSFLWLWYCTLKMLILSEKYNDFCCNNIMSLFLMFPFLIFYCRICIFTLMNCMQIKLLFGFRQYNIAFGFCQLLDPELWLHGIYLSFAIDLLNISLFEIRKNLIAIFLFYYNFIHQRSSLHHYASTEVVGVRYTKKQRYS